MENLREAILIGFLMGTAARMITLKSDYRQYPSYPQGYAIHIVLGAVAASIGALIIPAVLDGEYTAVSFFALAVQQFREVKNAERDTLQNLEKDEIVKRGSAYIEDIARKFEVRNYLAMLTAFFVSISILIFQKIWVGISVGLVLYVLIMRFIREKYIEDIGEISIEKLYFKGSYLMAGQVVITNVGTKEVKDTWLQSGLACRISPKNENARMTLSNAGQQQAILHDLIGQMGNINDASEPWYAPYAKMDIENGSIIVAAVTYRNDEEVMKIATRSCPVIESARKEPQKSIAFGKGKANGRG